jgi:glycosyltransferase involved in cell wall biosynthesis
MKLWLIKLGKVWTALREEGLFRGGRRVLVSLRALFHRVGSGQILFITVTIQDNPFLVRYAERFRIFVFHRTLVTPRVARLIERIKAQGGTILFDTDDLVFDAQYFADMDYARTMNALERKQYEHGVGKEIVADASVTTCTASTDFLAEKLRQRGKQVFVVPNRLSQADVTTMDGLIEAERTHAHAQDESVVIGYFSGAKGHDRDFAVVTESLLDILERYPQVRLFIAGPLTLDARFGAFHERIIRQSYVPREEHFANLLHIDINIAPLEVGNPFCESKSELKFFEAGYLGVPTVASATRTFSQAMTDGVDGYTALTTEEWIAKLSRLIEDEALRHTLGERAHETVVAKYTTTHAANSEYYEFLRGKIGK